MNTDVFFTTGTTHKICQDYALNNRDPSKPFVIVSDGCSSAPDTDFGSRLLVKAAEPHIYQECFHDTDAFLYGVLSNAHTYCRTLQLPDDSLCATLLLAKIEGNFFKTICVGDGLVATKDAQTGELIIHEYDFESGAPYYLRYELDPAIKAGYFEKFGNKGTRTTYVIKPDGTVTSTSIPLPFDKDNIYFDESFPLDRVEFVAIFSDGAKAFVKQNLTSTSKQNKVVTVTDILKETLSFKGYVGEYVQRRCNKAFKTFRDEGLQNCDDFSLAVIAKEKDA